MRGARGRIRGQTKDSYLEGLFIDVDVVSSFDLFGLAEEDQILKQEDVAEVFPPSAPHNKLILAAELTLLFQVHLGRKRHRSRASTTEQYESSWDSDLTLKTMTRRPPLQKQL